MRIVFFFVLFLLSIADIHAQQDSCFPERSIEYEKMIHWDKQMREAFESNNYALVAQFYDSINNLREYEISWPYPHIKMAIYSYRELIKNADEPLESTYADKIDQLYQLGLMVSNEEIMNQGWAKEDILSSDFLLYTVTETPPSPKGGMKTLYKYVNQNLRYPDSARTNGIEGKVYVQFIVDKDGNILNAKAIHGIKHGCDQEAERIIRDSPDWEPGRQRSNPVYVRMVLPITFKFEKKDKRKKRKADNN